MTTVSGYLQFAGLDAPVELRVDQRFVDALPVVFPKWAHKITATAPAASFASIVWDGQSYLLESPFMDKPKRYPEPVNTLVSAIVELAWARLRGDTSLLCLHGAAVEFAGRLVVFPSTRRAGKSTLTVALAAADKRVFTDDFLPLKITEGELLHGVSSGISPRLRLPLPEQIGPVAEKYIGRRSSISNSQYRFVAPISDELASFGDTAPIGSLVFLERSDGATAALEPMKHADALTALIKQNFSRAMNAGGILKMLDFISSSAPAYRLIYDEAEPAIAVLNAHFSSWTDPVPAFPADLSDSIFHTALDAKQATQTIDVHQGSFLQASGVTEAASDGKRFLTGRNGQSIHYLNDGAATIWHLLDEPTSVAEAIEMLCAVFPDHPADQIRQDVVNTFTEFSRNGLLQIAEPVCQTPEIEAVLPV